MDIHPIAWLLTKLRICKFVWLRDYDGDVTLSLKHEDPRGAWARRLCFTDQRVRLNKDGTCSGIPWVKEWADYQP